MRSLKFFLGLALFITSLTSSVGQSNDSAFVLNIDQCIAYALQNNDSLKNAQLDVRAANYQVRETVGLGLPQVNGEVSYTNDFAIRTSFLPAEFLGGEPGTMAPVKFGIPHSATVGLTVNQLIFDGSYLVGLQASNVYQDLSRKAEKRTKVDIIYNVTTAFYTVLINEERAELLQQNYHQLDSLLRETRIMYENGFSEKIDVDRVRLRFNNIKTEVANVNRALFLSKQLLKFQIGMPLSHELELSGSLDNLDLDFNLEVVSNDFTFEQRIEYSILQTQKQLATLNLKNNRVANYPSLYGFLGMGYNAGTDNFSELTNFSDNWFSYGNFGLTLSVPIFSGLQRHYTTQQAKIEVFKSENNLNNLKKAINLELVTAKTQLQNSLATLESEKENMELARGIFNATKIKYQEGLGSNLEVIEAETSYKEAETNYYSAMFDALVAKIDLEKALGILNKE